MKIVLTTLAVCLLSWFFILFVIYHKTGKLSLPAMVISHTLVACIGLSLMHFWAVADNESKPFKAVANNETRYYTKRRLKTTMLRKKQCVDERRL